MIDLEEDRLLWLSTCLAPPPRWWRRLIDAIEVVTTGRVSICAGDGYE